MNHSNFKTLWNMNWYLEPQCKNPKNSWTFDAMEKYLLDPLYLPKPPIQTRITIFSTNLYVANKTPTPCSTRKGENTTGPERCLAPDGVP